MNGSRCSWPAKYPKAVSRPTVQNSSKGKGALCPLAFFLMKSTPITFLLILAALLAAAPDPQTSPKKSASAKKTTAKRKGKSAARPAARQLTPTPERYKEIQQALAKKGYLKSEPNGVWGADSTEALRQFQTDQKLAPSGKINASSLIALGLGPKTAGPATGSVPPAEPPKPSSARPDQPKP